MFLNLLDVNSHSIAMPIQNYGCMLWSFLVCNTYVPNFFIPSPAMVLLLLICPIRIRGAVTTKIVNPNKIKLANEKQND
jgi:hypothetical protein